MTHTKARYLTCCIDSDGPSINAMTDCAHEITYPTFARNVEWQDWAHNLGYIIGSATGLHLKDDWHVAYYRGQFQGKQVYYAVWSAIEYIFTTTEQGLLHPHQG